MKGVFLTADADAGIDNAKSLWEPVLTKLASYSGMKAAETGYADYANFKAYFDARFGSIDGSVGSFGVADHDHMKRDLFKRHGDMTEAMGIVPFDSRLLGESHLASMSLASALKSSLPKIVDGQLRGHLIGEGKVFNPPTDTSVLSAWRKSYVHLIGTGCGVVKVDALRTLAPDTDAYVNEVCIVKLCFLGCLANPTARLPKPNPAGRTTSGTPTAINH